MVAAAARGGRESLNRQIDAAATPQHLWPLCYTLGVITPRELCDRLNAVYARRFTLLLLIVLLLAAALRVKFLLDTSHISLWLDEFFSLEWSAGRSLGAAQLPLNTWIDYPPVYTSLQGAPSAWGLFARLENDVQSPLYYIVLRYWRELFGSSDLAVELLSTAFSVSAVAFLTLGVRHLAGPAVALWSGLLLTLAPLQFVYARAVRPYAMALALTAALFWVLMVLARPQRRDHPEATAAGAGTNVAWHGAAGMLALLLMLTHYLAAGVIAGLVLWTFCKLPRRDRVRLLPALALAAAAFLTLCGPLLLRQWAYMHASGNTSWMTNRLGAPWFTAWASLADVPRMFLLEGLALKESQPAIVLGVLLLLLAALRALWRRQLLAILLWLVCGVGLIAALDVALNITQLAYSRFVLLAAPAFYVLLASIADAKPGVRMLAAHGALALLAALLLTGDLFFTVHRRATAYGRFPFQRVAGVLQQQQATREPLVLFVSGMSAIFPGYPLPSQKLYLSLSHYTGQSPRRLMLLEDEFPPAAQRVLGSEKSFWCVLIQARPPRGHFRGFDGFVPVAQYVIPGHGSLVHLVRQDLAPNVPRRKPVVLTPPKRS